MTNQMNFLPFTIQSDEGTAGTRWKKWLNKFENFLLVCNVTDDKRKKAMFLHYIGDEAYEIYDSFTDTEKGIGAMKIEADKNIPDEYTKVIDSFTKYFTPKKNLSYEVFKFRQLFQQTDESMNSYHTKLKTIAANCEFANPDREIVSQIIQGCKSSRLRRRALKDNMSLDDILTEARAMELSESRAAEIEKGSAAVNRVYRSTRGVRRQNLHPAGRGNRQQNLHPAGRGDRRENPHPAGRGKRPDHPQRRRGSNYQQYSQRSCHYCGNAVSHQQCPAKGKECSYCHKIGHFSRVCNQRKIRQLNAEDYIEAEDLDVSTLDLDSGSSSSDESVFVINKSTSIKLNSKQPLVNANLLNTQVNFLIDTGASVNIVSGKTFANFKTKPKLKTPHNFIFAYGSTKPLNVRGYFNADIEFKNNCTNTYFYVIDSNESHAKDLLSLETSQSLGMIQFALSSTMPISSNFPSLFDGTMGKIKDVKIKLHIDNNIQPVTQRHRRIPFHIRKDVEAELNRLEKLQVIERIEGPTPWISPIVTVPKKSGGVRICVDMREANKAIKREKHPMPTIDDLISDLNESKVFSKLDLSNAYHQLELDEESRYITTFTTHLGLFRYKRLIFGVNAAAEIFQKTIADLIHDIQGAQNLSDDIIIHGKNQQEHDKTLYEVMKRLDDNGAKLNKDKCKFSENKLTFFGHIFSNKGVSADPEKVKIIGNCPSPTSSNEVRSFLGMAQYVARYIPKFATITEPLRKLTKLNEQWKWTDVEQTAFDQIKSLITSSKVMAYFNPKKETQILVDASPVGLGAILMQDEKVICYASRALTPTEQRYSQTDKEMLAVVYGVEHFHLYLFGSTFSVITDHKPLIGIMSNQKPATARMERWRLRLIPYEMNLIYRPGKDENNPADYISRHPQTQPRRENAAEKYIAYITTNNIPKAMTKEEVKIATNDDPKLQRLIQAIQTGDWNDKLLTEFIRFQDEISIHDGLVLRDHRLIIPQKLQSKVIDIAHQSHQGIVKTKQFIREKVWFPNIDRLVEETIKSCIPCQASHNQKIDRDPIIPTTLPDEPWQSVSMDFLGPFPTGEYLLVMIDDYSRYPEVEIISNISARIVIPKIETIFARQGIPEMIRTDNGAPFNGKEFYTFSQQFGFKHRKVTPMWPEANGEAERFMKTLNKFVRTQVINNHNWKLELHTFLMHYRSTPHSSIKISPFKALTGRDMNSGLPRSTSLSSKPSSMSNSLKAFISQKDRASKENMIEYANNKRKVKPHNLSIGDQVLVKQKKINKFSTPFNPKPFSIIKIKGSMITAKSVQQNNTITRNSSHFKKIRPKLNLESSKSNRSKSDSSVLDLPVSGFETTSKSLTNTGNNNNHKHQHIQTYQSAYFPFIPADLNSDSENQQNTRLRSSPAISTQDLSAQQQRSTPTSDRPSREKKLPAYLKDYSM